MIARGTPCSNALALWARSAAGLFALFTGLSAGAQDLDPRGYTWVPTNASLLIAGFSYSEGGVLTDATLPIQDLHATVAAPMLGVAHSFGLFGKTAQALVALPCTFADASALVQGEPTSVHREGFSDMRMRVSILLKGAPAASIQEIAQAERRTIIGASLNVIAPTGQFMSDKLINLGANRWSVRPELALSQPIGSKWLVDVYAGLWLFTNNTSFFPGDAKRSQTPMGTFQGHLSYTIKPRLWVAFNSTFYTGGTSTVNGLEHDDRQSNARVGGTLVLPVGKRHSLKLAASTGAIVRIGANFTTCAIGWQTIWLGKGKPKPPVR